MKKLVIGLIVLLVVLWVGLYVAVKIALPPEKVQALVHEHGSKAVGRDIHVGGASIGVFPTIKIVIKDVTLANAEGFSEDPMFNLKKIVLAIDFMSLVRFTPIIKEIRIEEPDILYEVDKKGRTNLDGLGGEPKAEEEKEEPEDKPAGPLKIPAALSLKSFVIENARVRYRDLKTGTVLTLGSINQQASVSVDKNLEDVKTRGELVVSSISVSDKKSGLRKGGVRISFGHDLEVNLPKQVLTINGMKLGLQDILIEVMGSVKDFMTPSPGVDIKIASNEIKMASILKEVPAGLSPDIPKLTAKGFAKLTASVIGVVDTASLPRVNAELSLNGMGFGHGDLPAGINDMNGFIHVTENSVEIKDFGFKLDQHPVNVAMLVTDLLEVPDLKNLAIDSRLDLGPLMALADKFAGLPEGFALSGQIASKIKARGKLDPQNPMGIRAQGNVSIKNISLAAAELPEKLLVNGEVNINNDKVDETLQVKIGNSDVSVKVNVQNYLAMALPELAKGKTTQIKVDVVSKMLDLDQLLPETSGEKEEEVVEETEPLESFPSLPPIDLTLNVRLNQTKLMDLEMTNYTQLTTIQNSIVSSNLVGHMYTGSFSNKISVDLQDTVNAKIAMMLKVNGVEANDFISRLNDKLPGDNDITKSLAGTDSTIYGKFSMDMDVQTNGLPQNFADNLTGLIYVKIHDGKLIGVRMAQGLNDAIGSIQEKVKMGKKIDLGTFTFSKLDATFEAKDGKLIVKHCELDDSPAGSLNLTGNVGFDTKLDLLLENHLAPILSKPILSAQKKLQGAASGVASKVPGVGDAAKAVAGSVALIPEDKSGRAIAYYAMTGTVGDPKYSVDFKRMQQEASGSAKEEAKEALKAAADAKLKEAKAKLDAEKKKLMDAAKQKEAEARAKIEAEKQKLEAKKKELEAKKKAAEEKAKQEAEKKKAETKEKAQDEAKKKLKKLGF
ncbi:AsmA family protein [Fibrobacterota bacterium]